MPRTGTHTGGRSGLERCLPFPPCIGLLFAERVIYISALRTLVARLANLQFEQFSRETVNDARLCLLDAIGCGLYGSTVLDGKKIISALSVLSAGDLPVWGSNVLLSRSDAALACGSLCHLRELDDVHYSIVHPGAVVVPAVYAAAFGREYSLKNLLAAIICGYEAMVRISEGSGYLTHRQKGWHATATMGGFGAAAACGKLLELEEQEFVWALGLAGSRTGGTWAFKADGSMSKRIHPGLAARDGLAAAFLAQAGISGPEYVLEAEDGGFYHVACEDWDLTELGRDWGKTWAISEVEFKWYAACKSVHSPLEASLQIAALGHRTEDIDFINVGINSSAMSMAGGMYTHDSVASAQLSIPYGVALGLSGRGGLAQDFENDAIADENLFRLAQKVRVAVSPKMEEIRLTLHKSAAHVDVVYKNGSHAEAEVHDAKGHIGNPLSETVIIDKFLGLASCAVGKQKAESICKLIIHGELQTPVDDIFHCLSLNR